MQVEEYPCSLSLSLQALYVLRGRAHTTGLVEQLSAVMQKQVEVDCDDSVTEYFWKFEYLSHVNQTVVVITVIVLCERLLVTCFVYYIQIWF